MDNFVEMLNSEKMKKLNEFRDRYSFNEYPVKLTKNLLYEGLTIQAMWQELQKSFSTFGNNAETLFDDFQSAHKHIFVRRRQIATSEILPSVDSKYSSVSTLPDINFSSLRTRADAASKGDPSVIEQIEFSYYFYTCAYEMIYAWSAYGLMGNNKEESYSLISPMKMGGIDYSDLGGFVHSLGQAASMFYSPLPPLL